MLQLELKSITCIKKQDTFGKDEPMIKLDGVKVWRFNEMLITGKS